MGPVQIEIRPSGNEGENLPHLLKTDTHQKGRIPAKTLGTQNKKVRLRVPQCLRSRGGAVEGIQAGMFEHLALSADGKYLAGPQGNSTLSLWDTTSGKSILAFGIPTYPGIKGFAFSPDGKMVAVVNADSTIAFWETISGTQRVRFGTPRPFPRVTVGGTMDQYSSDPHSVVVFAPDGKTLAVGSPDGKLRLWDADRGQELVVLEGHSTDGKARGTTYPLSTPGRIESLAFSMDGKRLASGSADTTALLWDLTNLKRPQHAPLLPRQAEALWNDLAADAAKAHQAIIALSHSPGQSVPLLRDRVQPVAAPAAERLQQLVAALESDEFAVRQKAGQELEQLGDLAEPALRRVLESKPSLDVRRRIEALLDKAGTGTWSGERLRLWRVIEVLEGIGTPDAQAVLKTLAEGAPASRLTQEAKASLERLAKRAGSGS